MSKSQHKENELDDLTTSLQTYLDLPFGLLEVSKCVLDVQAIKWDKGKKTEMRGAGRRDADHLHSAMQEENQIHFIAQKPIRGKKNNKKQQLQQSYSRKRNMICKKRCFLQYLYSIHTKISL